jgi:hypothetical protein
MKFMKTTSIETMAVGVHPFERAGLGIAPFKFVGSYESVFQAVPGDPDCPIQPGSCCDYCFQGIRYVCRIRSADGREFKVGCDCVYKTGDKRVITDAKRAENKRRTEATHNRADAKIEAARLLLPTVADKLRVQPHPYTWQAERGETMLDRVEWLLANAGRKGKLEAAKIIAQAQ